MGDIVNKQYLIDFETEVKERYERGEIHSPVHLSSNNEEHGAPITIIRNGQEDEFHPHYVGNDDNFAL